MIPPEKVAGLRRSAEISRRYSEQGTGILAAEIAKVHAENRLEEAIKLSFHIQKIYEELVLALMHGDTHTVSGRTAEPGRLPLVMAKRGELNQEKAKARMAAKESAAYYNHVFTRHHIEQLSKEFHRALDNVDVYSNMSSRVNGRNATAEGEYPLAPTQIYH